MRTCDREGCEERATHMVGWIPAAERVQEDRATTRRCWFYGCAEHARWVWKIQHANGASPVWRSRE